MNSTKERITQESAILFARNGVKTITMDDIASSMGISKRTIYENFSDKKELVAHCMQYFLRQGEGMLENALNNTDNIIDALFQASQCDSEMMRSVKQTLFQEIQKYFPDVYNSTVQDFKEKRLAGSRKLIEKGQLDGVIRKDIDPALVALLIQSIFNQIILHDLCAPYNKELMVTMFMYNYARGITTEKGLKIINKYMDLYIENTKKLS